jgi:exodeoxyribonuclease V beta subunit
MSAGIRPLEVESVPLEGTHLIEAGAGTGKTFTIVSLYVRLLLERELEVSQILVVTYTVAATAELRSRIRARLAELVPELERQGREAELPRVREALRGFDRAAIFTIHGFCQRALAEHAFESSGSFDSELLSDQGALIDEIAEDFFARELHGESDLLLGHVTRKLDLGRLRALAERVASRPDLLIRPGRSRTADHAAEISGRESRWREAWHDVAKAWPDCRAEVIEVLEAARLRGDLYAKRYPEGAVPGHWAPAMDTVLLTPVPDIEKAFPKFEKFTTSVLASATKKKATATLEHPFFELCDVLLAAEGELKAVLDAWRTDLELDFVDYAREELARRKREQDVLFFDDLLQGLRDALDGGNGEALARAVRARHPVALIDEFQDTDPVQYAIFERIWHGTRGGGEPDDPGLFLIGDPKQAIYAFRGADVHTYLDARSDAGDNVYSLTRNHRSDPGLVGAVNTVFGSLERPFATADIAFQPVEPSETARDRLSGDRIRPGLRISFVPRDPADVAGNAASRKKAAPKGLPGRWKDRLLAPAIASEVARWVASDVRIDGRELVPGDVAVLTRTNAQAREVQAALRAHGIVGVLQSEESVFGTDEAAELERVMRAISEPENVARARAALATTLLSRSAAQLVALGELGESGELTDEGEESGASDSWESFNSCLRSCRKVWNERGFVQALRWLWVERQIGVRLLSRDDGERRVTNLLHLGELLQQAALEGRLGPLALIHWFARRREEARAKRKWVSEDAQLRLESDDDAVQLVTVHRSKGLEYPVTVCPYLWDGKLIRQHEAFPRFHDPETGRLAIDLERDKESDNFRLAESEVYAENQRLLYVALTRARHHCSVVWGAFDGSGRSPLGHVLHPVATDEGALPDAKRIVSTSDEDLLAELAKLVNESSGTIEVVELDPSPGPVLPTSGRPAAVGAALTSRRAGRRLSGAWRVSSFSGLVQAAPDASVPIARVDLEAEEGRDYDARRLDDPDRAAVAAPSPERVVLADFPAGAMPGILIHEIFEHLDFRETGAALESLVAKGLAQRGLEEKWRGPLVAAIRDVLAVPLEEGRPESALFELSRADRLDEMGFVLPVRSPPGSGALTAGALADVFERHAANDMVRRYAERARRLDFPALLGHLRGFVDLVFRRGERWYLADYKSNWLGPAPADYGAAALEHAMYEHDYVLQYHLYLVALHRHLALRLPDYDYGRHMGGAYYLFLRGMSPAYASGDGVLHDLPPRALIEGLSQLLAGPMEAGS